MGYEIQRPGDVALLAEGVDRNLYQLTANVTDRVALLAEGVDRNNAGIVVNKFDVTSPSSRRAWIEMVCRTPPARAPVVALLAEGVDRNWLNWQPSW